MSYPDFLKAFQPEQKANDTFGDIILNPYEVGELVLTSGKLVACDPLTIYGAEPFTTNLNPGRYPVILSVAHRQYNNDKRVAYAMLCSAEQAAVRWELAIWPGADLSQLKEGEFFGYGVDAGTGGFMDYEVTEILDNSNVNTEVFFDSLGGELLEILEKNYSPTWSWANMCVDDSTQANVIAFSSGDGDGVYPTYFGYDAEDNIVFVVTDFLVCNLE